MEVHKAEEMEQVTKAKGWNEQKEKSDAKANKFSLCAVWHGLPGRHLGHAVLTSHCFSLAPHCWWRLQDHPAACSVDHNYPPSGSTPAAGTTISFNIWCVSTNTQFMKLFHRKFQYVWIYIAHSKGALQTRILFWEVTSCSRACCCKALALTSSCTHSSSWHFSASGSWWNRFCKNAIWDLRTCRSFWTTKRPQVKWNNCKVGLIHKAREVETEAECDVFTER